MRMDNQIDFLDNFPQTERMPVLFLGHGSPMNAIEENSFVRGFRAVSKVIPKPKAILCISAHWCTRGSKVTAMKMPPTIYDFEGFPQELYNVKYPAKGSPELAGEIQKLLLPVSVELDHNWGLDHGAWSVLRHLYPNADVPVVQLSIDFSRPAQYHFELAKRLGSLRQKGILIVGSGNIVHNLGLVDYRALDKENYGYDWAVEANEKMKAWLLGGDFQSLIDYEKQGKAILLAVPTPEHFIPLVCALALKEEGDTLTLFNDKLVAGSLSMTSVLINDRTL